MKLFLISFTSFLFLFSTSCTVKESGGISSAPSSGNLTDNINKAKVIDFVGAVPQSTAFANGTAIRVDAYVQYTDATTLDLSDKADEVDWVISGNPTFATVEVRADSGAPEKHHAYVTGVTAGPINLKLTYKGKTKDLPLTVSAAALSAVHIQQPTVSLPAGLKQTFTVQGDYTDGTHQIEDASSITWSVGVSPFVSIANNGELTAISVGSAVVTASKGGFSSTADVTVTDAILDSLSVEPNVRSIALGDAVSLKAFEVYSDGFRKDVSSTATWSSADPATAASEGGGLIRGLVQGQNSVVTATSNGKSGTSNVTVSDKRIVAIKIYPTADGASWSANSVTLKVNHNIPFTAKARYSDESADLNVFPVSNWEDITTNVDTTWRTNAEAKIAFFSPLVGSEGVLNPISPKNTANGMPMGQALGFVERMTVEGKVLSQNVFIQVIDDDPPPPMDPGDDDDDGGGIGSVICTELNRQGFLPSDVLKADTAFGKTRLDKETMANYHAWGVPMARWMSKSPILTSLVKPLAKAWAYEMAYRMGEQKESNELGALMLKYGVPLSNAVGKTVRYFTTN